MNRETAYSLLSLIMSGSGSVDLEVPTDLMSDPDPPDEDSSSSEEGDGPSLTNLDCRIFYDFTSADSLPNITIKTFLLDCIQHPKILYHKDLEFFRSYLIEVGIDMTLPPGSPFPENHEDLTFCVDKGDTWLNDLKERVDPEHEESYWASVIPVKRRHDLGLVVFRWEFCSMSLHFLSVYLKFCENISLTVSRGEECVDIYIRDFKRMFDIERNMDVEARFKDDAEARLLRKAKEPPKPKPATAPVLKREIRIILERVQIIKPTLYSTQKTISTATYVTNTSVQTKENHVREPSISCSETSVDESDSDSSGSSVVSRPALKYKTSGVREPSSSCSETSVEENIVEEDTSGDSSSDEEYTPSNENKVIWGVKRANQHSKRTKNLTIPLPSSSKGTPRIPNGDFGGGIKNREESRKKKQRNRRSSPDKSKSNPRLQRVNESSSSVPPSRTIRGSNGFIKRSNGIIVASPKVLNGGRQRSIETESNGCSSDDGPFICNLCAQENPRKKTMFTQRKSLFGHLKKVHPQSKSKVLVRCCCGVMIRKETFEYHKKICKKSKRMQVKKSTRMGGSQKTFSANANSTNVNAPSLRKKI